MLYLVKTENSSEDAVFGTIDATYDFVVSNCFVKSIIELSFNEIEDKFINKEYTIEQFKKLVLLT